jgi:hypothetical protein
MRFVPSNVEIAAPWNVRCVPFAPRGSLVLLEGAERPEPGGEHER